MSKIRVSCSNLVRVNLDSGIVLSLNRDRAGKGLAVYTPVGGVLTADDETRHYLTDTLGCEFRNEDLRFNIDVSRLPAFENWFFSYDGREVSPLREIREELVDEQRVFGDLPRTKIRLERLFDVEERKVTDKPGSEGALTQRYFEVWGANFSPDYEDILRADLAKQDSTLLLASESEIRGLKSRGGREIRDNSLALVVDKVRTPYRTVTIGSSQISLYKNG